MRIGEIVVCKKDRHIVGEVLEIDDMDRARLKLCKSGVTVWADICDLENAEKGDSQMANIFLWIGMKIEIMKSDSNAPCKGKYLDNVARQHGLKRRFMEGDHSLRRRILVALNAHHRKITFEAEESPDGKIMIRRVCL